jgi:4a-hydroxytetrahydrobiopterin dehydratase
MSTLAGSALSHFLNRRSNPKPVAALPDQIEQWKFLVPDWHVSPEQISREFKFTDYYHTIAFVNAVAWIAHGEDHHPDLIVGYNRCVVNFSTHSVGGLSENDFICAAKVSALSQL